MKLQNAYETISDPAKRREYDLRWLGIRDSLRAQQESEKRQAEAAQAEKKRAAEARAKKQEEEKARQERLQNLEQSRSLYDRDFFELSRKIRKLVADLKNLKDQDEEDVRKEKERNGWWAYLTSPIYGQVKETDDQEQERKRKHCDRQASKRIKGSELAEKEARLQKLQDALRDVNGRIAAEKRKVEDEKIRIEREARARKMKLEQEAKEQESREAWERIARSRREQAERAAKEAREAREAQAAREAWEAQERARVAAAAAERRRREADERAQAIRTAEEVAQKAREKRNEWSRLRRTESTCLHQGWWPKVEGRQLCANCHSVQNRFALQCPGCSMVACASCQKSLRGGRWKSGGGGGGAGRRYGFAASVDYDYDDNIFFDYD